MEKREKKVANEHTEAGKDFLDEFGRDFYGQFVVVELEAWISGRRSPRRGKKRTS